MRRSHRPSGRSGGPSPSGRRAAGGGRAALAGLLTLLVGLGGLGPPARAETPAAARTPEAARPPEAAGKLAAADALLGEQARWPEAIATYRALAAADPDWIAPRRQLARVLAWQGDYDESLALYAQLLAAPAPPPDAAIERAEVLSWAGRSDEARAAFEAILAARPDDTRAARGLARVYRWSGDRAAADRWYARALAAEDDAEARQEWRALRDELRRSPEARARWFRDSDGFSYLRSEASLTVDLDFDTALRFSSGSTRASVDDWPAGAPLADGPEEDRGIDGRVAVERRLTRRWKGSLELGGRSWEHGDARPLGRVALDFAPDERTSVSMELRHDDLLERSFSLASVLRGIGDTTLAASAWRQLSPRWEGWTGVEGSLFTDGNGQGAAAASVAFRPWKAHQILFGLAAGVSGYGSDSLYYYSPSIDASGTLSVQGRLPVVGPLWLAFDVGGGLGYAVEAGEAGFGPAYRVKAGLAYRRGGLTLSLDLARSQSQRSIEYTSHEVQLALGWSF